MNRRDLTKPSDVVYEKCTLAWDIYLQIELIDLF